jgi:tetratricopeptide (TPR) repeat protein
MTSPYLQTLLREGIDAARAGQKERARELLQQVVETDQTNLQAWLWLSSVVDEWADKHVCLENVLTLDPNHQAAQAGLAWLDQHAPPLTLRETAPFTHEMSAPAARAEPAPKAKIPCPFCGQPVHKQATVCRHCGFPLSIDCPACGAPVDVQMKACPQCGQKTGDYRRGPLYFASLATAYQEHSRHDQALKSWRIVEALDPSHPDLDLHLGEAQVAIGQTNEAIASFQRALERQPGQLTACLALGEIMGQLHRWQEAHVLYTQALAATPDSPQAHFALGSLLMETNELKTAFAHIHQTTQLDPQHGPAWLRLGQLYELAGELRSATHAYERAIALLPPGSLDGKEAQRQMEKLHPPLPEAMVTSWFELIREMTGPTLIGVLIALFDAGLRPWWISWTGWVALVIMVLGTFLWVSATSLPRNPLIRQLGAERSLQSSAVRTSVAFLGALFWLAAMSVILLPLGKSAPEMEL